MGFENSAGLGVRNQYGPRSTDVGRGAVFGGVNQEKVGVWEIDLAEYVTQTAAGITDDTVVLTRGGQLGMETIIPAYSQIQSCELVVLEALATTSGSAATTGSIQVGLIQSAAATEIDYDGLIDATDGSLTITSNDIAEPRGNRKIGHSAALIANTQYDGDSTGDPVDTTTVEKVSIGANDAELYVHVVSDDSTGQATMTGKVRITVKWVEE